MTAPEKVAPIPADVLALAAQYDAKARVSAWSREEAIRNAILADRAARPSAVEEPAPTIEAEERIQLEEADLLDLTWDTMPPYGMLSFDQLREAVSKAIIGDRNFYGSFGPSYSRGHQQIGACNYNSLNRIVTAFILADRARLRKGGAHGE